LTDRTRTNATALKTRVETIKRRQSIQERRVLVPPVAALQCGVDHLVNPIAPSADVARVAIAITSLAAKLVKLASRKLRGCHEEIT
jgi:hypothetical protein